MDAEDADAPGGFLSQAIELAEFGEFVFKTLEECLNTQKYIDFINLINETNSIYTEKYSQLIINSQFKAHPKAICQMDSGDLKKVMELTKGFTEGNIDESEFLEGVKNRLTPYKMMTLLEAEKIKEEITDDTTEERVRMMLNNMTLDEVFRLRSALETIGKNEKKKTWWKKIFQLAVKAVCLHNYSPTAVAELCEIYNFERKAFSNKSGKNKRDAAEEFFSQMHDPVHFNKEMETLSNKIYATAKYADEWSSPLSAYCHARKHAKDSWSYFSDEKDVSDEKKIAYLTEQPDNIFTSDNMTKGTFAQDGSFVKFLYEPVRYIGIKKFSYDPDNGTIIGDGSISSHYKKY